MLFSTDMDQLAYVSRKAAAFVCEHDGEELAPGRYDLGDGDYVNVMEYTSKNRAAACYESHEEYADIQMVLCGAECLEVAPTAVLEVETPYDSEGDCALYSGGHAGERFLMVPGRFCLVGPADGHMPGVAVGGDPAPVKKAVFKIKMAHLEPTAAR